MCVCSLNSILTAAMAVWDTYPSDYRAAEVNAIITATQAGECASISGLSGSGKTNLLGFIANRVKPANIRYILVDCNRLTDHTSDAFFRLVQRSLGTPAAAEETGDELGLLDTLIGRR